MTSKEQEEYKILVQQYKELKKIREGYINELAEKKGNLAAYQAEKNEQLAKAKELKVDPKNLKQEIDKLFESIKTRLDQNKKICEELEKTPIG